MANINSGIYTLPPLILSQDISQSYWPWSGYVPSTQTNGMPTSPQEIPANDTPFKITTNELDKYRLVFLGLGIIIGVYLLGKR